MEYQEFICKHCDYRTHYRKGMVEHIAERHGINKDKDMTVALLQESLKEIESMRQTIATLNESLATTSAGNFKLREQLAECERERDELNTLLMQQTDISLQIQRELFTCEKQLAAVTKDAERYRWLRYGQLANDMYVVQYKFPRRTWQEIRMEEIDAAIDEALAKVGAGKTEEGK